MEALGRLLQREAAVLVGVCDLDQRQRRIVEQRDRRIGDAGAVRVGAPL